MSIAHTTAAAVSQLPARERVGYNIEANDSVDGLQKVREAEDNGARQLWMNTGSIGFADTLTFCAAAASLTKNVRLGTSIVPTLSRHPIVTAQQTLAIHDIGPGRFRLGVGPSNAILNEQVYGLSTASPLSYLREYVSVLRKALWKGKVNHRGKYFTTEFAFPRTAQVPILVSALGEKAFHLAGQISDGAISWLCPIQYLLKKAIPSLRSGAESIVRPPPPVIAHLLVAISTNNELVLRLAQARVQPYTKLPYYANMFAEAGVPVAADGQGIDALVQELVIAGDESTVRQRLLELLATGLDELLITLLPVTRDEKERKNFLQLIGSL